MKTIIIILVLMFTVSVAFADNSFKIENTVGCNSYRTVVGNLVVDYEEKMVWEGQQENDVYTALYVNKVNGSWTIMRYDSDKVVACILAEGIGYDIP